MDARALAPAVVMAIQMALEQNSGDVLVFLPGKREIRAVQQQLVGARQLPGNTEALALHGDLPLEAQDALLAVSAPGDCLVTCSDINTARSSIAAPDR